VSDPVRIGRPEAAAEIWAGQRRARTTDLARDLRKSGAIRGVVAIALGSLVALVLHRPIVGGVAIAIGALTLGLALLSPTRGYAALSRGVDRVGKAIGVVLTWLLLTPVFLLFFVPFGLLARRGAGDRLGRVLERERPSYWRKRAPEPPGSLDRPY
jgi:hypothetical protein